MNDRRRAPAFTDPEALAQQKLIDAVHASVYVKDARGIYVAANQAFLRLLAREHDAVVGRSARDVFPAEIAAVYERQDRELRDRATQRSFEAPFENALGQRRVIHVHKTLLEGSGDEPWIVGTVYDITEWADARDRLKRLFDALPQLVLLETPRGEVGYLNRALMRHLDVQDESVVGLPVGEIFPDTGPEAEAQRVELSGKVKTTGKPLHGLVQPFVDRSGRRRWLETAVLPFEDPGEGGLGLLYVSTEITEKLEAQRELEKSEHAYKQLFEENAAVQLIVDAGDDPGRILDANRAAVSFYGWSRRDLAGMHISEINGLPRERVSGFIAECRAGRRRTFFLDHTLRDGRQRRVESFAAPLVIRGALRVLVNVRDITEEVESAHALEQSENTLRSLVNAAPLGIGHLRERKVVWGNERVAQITGYSRAELVGLDARVLYASDEEYERVGRQKKKDIEEKGWSELTTVWKRKDGTRVHVQVNAAPLDPRDHSRGLTATVLDITERLTAEAALHRLGQAIGQAAESVVITDPAGRIVYVNPAVESLTGYRPDELLGRDMREIKGGEEGSSEIIDEAIRVVLEQGSWQGRLVSRRRDGSFYEEEGTLSAVRAPDSSVQNVVAVTRDVTREARLESQLRHAQKMEAIGTLAGGIAHDFNNILAAILGHAELLQLDLGESASPARQSCEEILKACMRATGVVSQILAFSKESEQRREVIDPVHVVREALALLRGSIPKTIEIREHLEEEAGAVYADPTALHQVVVNLCTNAYQAMREQGGVLSVRLERAVIQESAASGPVELQPGPHVRISVIDSGPGIPLEIQKRIFEPYFTTRGQAEGTGLGLSIVHGIVASLDGAVRVHSHPGAGARFEVYLPLHQGTSAERGESHVGQEALGGEESILVVDDEPSLVEVAREHLSRIGYRVRGVTSSREALALLLEDASGFDLVVTDQTMPALTGEELAARLKAEGRDIPIVLCSGYSSSLSEEDKKAMGVREFLSKPFTALELARTVRRLLDEREPKA